MTGMISSRVITEERITKIISLNFNRRKSNMVRLIDSDFSECFPFKRDDKMCIEACKFTDIYNTKGICIIIFGKSL